MLPVLDTGRSAGALVLLSGGLDSCVLAAWAKQHYGKVEALSLGYMAIHGHAEGVAAERVARALGIPRIHTELPRMFAPNALVDGTGTNVVPARNTVFLAHAIARAAVVGASVVLIGSCQDDHADFPDCRPPFFTFAARMAELGSANTITVRAPFCTLPKTDIITMGITLGAPLHLTHTCYKGERPACGQCQACKTRAAAFAALEMDDPILATAPIVA